MTQTFSRGVRLIAALSAIAWLAGCGPSGEVQQVQSNESVLRGMIASDHQEIEGLQEQVGRINDHLAEMEHNGGAGKGADAMQQRLSKLESQVASMQQAAAGGAAGTAVPGAVAGAAPGTPGAPGTESAAPGGDVASGGPANGSPAVPPPATPPEASAPTWQSAMDQELATRHDDPAAKLYRSALVDMKGGKYANASAKFQELQRRYPKSELSEPAEFFAANALYETGKFDQSILQFNDLTMRFPNGRFASASLLREAQAFMKINDRIDARLTLQKLLNDHPNAPEAASAKSMMQTLSG